MRVCVFGAGAIGGHLAGRLVEGGATVSVVARGEHLAAMRRDGLRVETPSGTIHAPVAASDDPAELGRQDAVVVTVKAPALPSVAAAIGPLLGPSTPVAFVMNGVPWWYFHCHGGPYDGRRVPIVDPDDAVWNAVGPERAVGGVVYSACEVVAPGVVEVESRRSSVVLGEPDGSRSERVEAVAAPLRAGGIDVEVTDRIRDAVWEKLLGNLSANPLGVLTQTGLGGMLSEPAAADGVRQLLREGLEIARALGRTVEFDADAWIASSSRLRHKPSVVQDLERGRPMEVDALFVAPLELARLAGVPTPLLDLVVALTRLRARQAGLYPA